MRKHLPSACLVLGLLVLGVVNLRAIFSSRFEGVSQQLRNSDVHVYPGPFTLRWYEVPLEGSKSVTGPSTVFLRNEFIEGFIQDEAFTNVVVVSITFVVWFALLWLCRIRSTSKEPNQSRDPTLASGTPGAGHQPRHP
jgi:hypothetical protein